MIKKTTVKNKAGLEKFIKNFPHKSRASIQTNINFSATKSTSQGILK